MPRAGERTNPFAQPTPKPKIIDLLKLITAGQKSTFRNLSRSLKRLPGVHPELAHQGNKWGWALSYRRGDERLCTLHFLPSKLDATITISRPLEEWCLSRNHLSRPTKRLLRSLSPRSPSRMVRMPVGSPRRARDLVRIVRYKVQAHPGVARRRPFPPERIAGARARTTPSA